MTFLPLGLHSGTHQEFWTSEAEGATTIGNSALTLLLAARTQEGTDSEKDKRMESSCSRVDLCFIFMANITALLNL
jgi:hypothetical protein